MSGAALAARNGAFGANSGTANIGLGIASNALGAYSGFKQGGAIGDTQGVANLAALGAKGGAFGAASGAVGAIAGDVAAPLALYSAVKNWQSGNTASDTLQGAEAGASIGSIVPGIGTVIGGVIGGAVGALSSAFGGGEKDPETTSFNGMVAANAKAGNNAVVQSLNPGQAYQSLAGMMDAKNNTAGHSTPLEMVFGREGEGAMMSQMSSTINSAISSGKISKSATPTQLYNQVVVPWLQSKGAYTPASAIISSNGTKNNGTIDSLITQLIGQWQSGSLNPSSKVGVSGQTISGLQAYGA